jgi:hypothetical protein
MTVGQMRRQMSSREWMEWSALYELEGEEREREAKRAKARGGRR